MDEDDSKIEVCFTVRGSGSLYLDLHPTQIPRIAETVWFVGDTVKGSEWEKTEFIVTGVSRSYNKDTHEQDFVSVQLDRGGL